jgi:hypothetical protein
MLRTSIQAYRAAKSTLVYRVEKLTAAAKEEKIYQPPSSKDFRILSHPMLL